MTTNDKPRTANMQFGETQPLTAEIADDLPNDLCSTVKSAIHDLRLASKVFKRDALNTIANYLEIALNERSTLDIAQQTAVKDARIAELEERARQAEARNVEYIADFAAERDALQTKLDEANAQVAMLVEALSDMHFAWLNSDKEFPHSYEDEASKKAQTILLSAKPLAEQWLADKIEEAVKPYQWRYMVSAPYDHPYDTEILIAHGYDGDTGGPCSVDRAWWDNNRQGWRKDAGLIADPQYWMPLPQLPEALEATEGLTNDPQR